MGNLNFHVQTFCLRRVQNSINNCHTTHRLPYKHCTAYHLSISGNFNPLKAITISSVLVSLDTNFLLRCFFFPRTRSNQEITIVGLLDSHLWRKRVKRTRSKPNSHCEDENGGTDGTVSS